MKTIERLDFPLRVYFKDGECHHDSAVIVFTHGAPAYVRASGPFVVYPWENIIRVADEAQGDGLMGKHKVLREENIRLHKLHTDKRLALHKALGLLDSEDLDHAALCERVANLRNSTSTTTANINADEAMWLGTLLASVVSKVSAALGRPEPDPRDPGAAHDLAGNVKVIRAGLASMTEQRDLAILAAETLQKDLISVTEQRDLLKRQLEELRAEIQESGSVKRVLQRQVDRLRHDPTLPQPKQVEPGGPIWVRVVDTSSKHFGLVGRLEGIEFDSKCGDEMWSVDLGGIANVRWKANVFAVVGTGRQGPGPNEAPKPDAEHQQAQNRDKWRATCLANGAKDCTVYFGPGEEVTIVVELVNGVHLDNVTRALGVEHGLRLTDYKIRTVRPAFKHPADNGQP